MTFAVTNTFTDGTTISASEVNQNFTDLETVLNGGLNSTHLAYDANISPNHLATPYQDVFVKLTCRGDALWVGTNIADIFNLPNDDSATYKFISAEWTQFQNTATPDANTFTLYWGDPTAGVGAAEQLGTAITPGAGTATGTVDLSAESDITVSATEKAFMLEYTVAGTLATNDLFTVTIKLKRLVRS